MTTESSLFCGSNSSTQRRLAGTDGLHIYWCTKTDLLHSINKHTFGLSFCHSFHRCILFFQNIILLFLLQFCLQVSLNILKVSIAFCMNLIHSNHQETIVITTLIKRRNRTFFCLKNPLECIPCTTHSCNIMLIIEHILTITYTKAVFCSFFLQVFYGCALAYILAELVIRSRISFF